MKNFSIFFCLAALMATYGCASFPSEKKANAKEEQAEKMARYDTLKSAVSENSLEPGTPIQTVKDRYGDPDNIFSSGSSTGSFEIWTYEGLVTKKAPIGTPIRLYINNGKLVSWNF